MATNATTTVPNTFNLEDRPQLATIFFVSLLAAHFYVLSRVLALIALKKHLGLKSTKLKIIIATFPVTFATILGVRTTTHALNNACAELVPYSYLVRFGIHIVLLCYQLRAFIVLKWFRQFGMHPERRARCIRMFFISTFTPAALIVLFMWVLGLGIQLNGVCTVGHEDKSDQVYLKKSRISLNSKLELQMATRWSTVLLVWDTLFRFSVVQNLIKAITGTDSPAYVPLVTAYSVSFACVYLSGMSCLFAFAFERARLKHFRLGLFCPGGPVRLFKLLTGRLTFTMEELEGHKKLLADMKQRNELLMTGRGRVATASSLAATKRTGRYAHDTPGTGGEGHGPKPAVAVELRGGVSVVSSPALATTGVKRARGGAAARHGPPQDVENPVIAAGLQARLGEGRAEVHTDSPR